MLTPLLNSTTISVTFVLKLFRGDLADEDVPFRGLHHIYDVKHSSGAVVQGYLHPSEPLTPDAQKMNPNRAVHWPPRPVRASETLTESQHATAAGWREEDVGLSEGAASSADKEYDTGCGPGCSKMH